ncbi:MAG TPA: MBL fold metallo-hydrolase [Acidimicrobiales bacterium]|nr:MBL fold metallo-hydrolase [Acidimicrobiales bacterium]
MTEDTQSWTVGDVRITSIVEAQTDGIPPQFFFPEATEELLQRHDWLVPRFADAHGRMHLRVQAFVVETGGRTLVVDPCVGNGKTRSLVFWHQQDWPFMTRFRAAGFDPADVDLVVHTHLHADHVGWDTHLDEGRWVPTFGRARHLYVQRELDWLTSLTAAPSGGSVGVDGVYDDSIGPIFDAGLADIVEPDAELGHGVRLEATEGHTPGHVSLWVESEGQVALLTGDFLHHPVQCAEPSWAEIGDTDPDRARATRRGLLKRAADEEVLFLGTHFPTEPGGRVVPAPDGDAWRFQPS